MYDFAILLFCSAKANDGGQPISGGPELCATLYGLLEGESSGQNSWPEISKGQRLPVLGEDCLLPLDAVYITIPPRTVILVILGVLGVFDGFLGLIFT